MSSKKRVGIVGLGVMGKNHARVISELESHQLVGFVDPLEELNKSHRYGASLVSLEELVKLQPDYCVIAAPTALHKSITSVLIKVGLNILIEKPLSHDLASSAEIMNDAKRSHSKIAVGHIERFNAAVQEAKAKIREGILGEIYQVSTSRQGPFPSRIADVGVTFDLATHDIDLTTWLVGSGYECVAAQKTHRTGRHYEDLLSVTAKLRNGVIVNHLVNWLSPYKERSIVILGEKGALKIDTLHSDLTFYKNGTFSSGQELVRHFRGVAQGEEVKFAFNRPEPLKVEHLDFIAYLDGGVLSGASLEEAYQNVRVADAISQSANELTVKQL